MGSGEGGGVQAKLIPLYTGKYQGIGGSMAV